MSTAAVPYPRLISSRTFASFAVQTFQPPGQPTTDDTDFTDAADPVFSSVFIRVHPWLHRLEHNRNDPAFDCFPPNPRGWKPRQPAFAEPTAEIGRAHV